METLPSPSPDYRAYLLIELLADGSVRIYMEGDHTQLWQYLMTMQEVIPKEFPREAA